MTTASAARVVFDGALPYDAPTGRATRPLRAWALPDGRSVFVVTEPADAPGMSVTNAAHAVIAALREKFGDQTVDRGRIIEHYPSGAGVDAAEHYDEVILPGGGEPRWRRWNTAALYELLGGTPHAPAQHRDTTVYRPRREDVADIIDGVGILDHEDGYIALTHDLDRALAAMKGFHRHHCRESLTDRDIDPGRDLRTGWVRLGGPDAEVWFESVDADHPRAVPATWLDL